MEPWRNDSGGAVVVAGAVFAASALLLFLTSNPVVALAPVALTLAAYAFVKVPLRWSLFALLTVLVTVEILPLRLPDEGQLWQSPLYPLYTLLFENLNKIIPIDALRFSAAEALFVVMSVLAVLREVAGERVDSTDRGPGTNVITLAVGVSFAAVLFLELWGIARGGDFRQSLWQARQLFWLPILTCLFGYCLRDERDAAIATVLLGAAACVKIGVGLYYMVTIAWPAHSAPPFITSHNDSVLFVVVMMAPIAAWAHAPSRRGFLLAAVGAGWMLLGIVLNGRRLAYVELSASLLLLYVLLRGRVKRSLTRLVLYSTPVMMLYIAAGRNHDRGFFRVAGMVASVVRQKDTSSESRDIENFNLLHTLKQSAVLGTGWGHEYIEVVKAYDISKSFPQYRFIAHNSVLWIWTIGGLVGSTLVWLPVVVGIFLARRAYAFARTPRDRTMALLCLSILTAYVTQAWGDMGMEALTCTLIAALALATAGKLAVATGAIPARVRFFGTGTAWRPSAVLGGAARPASAA
jgi:hypothetical protein